MEIALSISFSFASNSLLRRFCDGVSTHSGMRKSAALASCLRTEES